MSVTIKPAVIKNSRRDYIVRCAVASVIGSIFTSTFYNALVLLMNQQETPEHYTAKVITLGALIALCGIVTLVFIYGLVVNFIKGGDHPKMKVHGLAESNNNVMPFRKPAA